MRLSDERVIELADELAWHLFTTESDAGELKKSLEYYRAARNRDRFLQMLRTRSNHPHLFQRSSKTRTYYQKMSQKIGEMLKRPELMTEDDALRVLGWAFRLVQFYKTEKPSHQVSQLPIVQDRPDREGKRRTGTVRWFNPAKKYGFITPHDGSNDVFVHLCQVADGQVLCEGQQVSFVMGTGPKGRPQSQDVQPE